MSEIIETAEDQVEQAEQVSTAPELPVYLPRTDISEGENGYQLVADLPGADEKSLEVTFEDAILTIRARPELPSYEGFQLAYGEYEAGEYKRSFRLSEEIDPQGIEAKLEHGVLRITLPRTQKVTRRIPVQLVTD